MPHKKKSCYSGSGLMGGELMGGELYGGFWPMIAAAALPFVSSLLGNGKMNREKFAHFNGQYLPKSIGSVTTKGGGTDEGANKNSWINFVKAYSEKHNIDFQKALKKAGPDYKKFMGGMQTGGIKSGGMRAGFLNHQIKKLSYGVDAMPKSKSHGIMFGTGKKKHKGGSGSHEGAMTNDWIEYVKNYASSHDIDYKDALKQAGKSYHKHY